MKKSLILLLLPVICFGQNQYSSSKMSFVYPIDFRKKDSRIIQDVSAKFVNKDYSRTENIVVNITDEYLSLGAVNKQKHINLIIKEIEVIAKALDSKYNSKLLNYQTKTIHGKKVISTMVKLNLIDYDMVIYQLHYLYIKRGKGCYIIVTYDDENDYSNIADFILKDFKFL